MTRQNKFVTVSKKKYVKDGKPMVFRGVGIGSWLNEADEIMDHISEIPAFQTASKELKYYMQFRQRGILYRF